MSSYTVEDARARAILHDASFLGEQCELAKKGCCTAAVPAALFSLMQGALGEFWKRIYEITRFCENDRLQVCLKDGDPVVTPVPEEAALEAEDPVPPVIRARRFPGSGGSSDFDRRFGDPTPGLDS